MLKTKDGYAKVIGTSYQGSSDYLLLSNGGQLGVNTLVRAGSYEKGDLNNLDTYSFIKSVMSSNKDTSPKGSIGWYNVIQAVYRNGSGDGPGYIGQIALGMTTNTNDMFFRGKRTDPWKTVIHSGNYTEFINNYYWANVKISTSSSTTTSPTVHTLTATRVCAGHDPEIDNSISCSNWFRSSGNTGWYNTTYEGGWYMSDTSWIRAHNDVGIYTGGQIYSSNSIRMGDIYLQNTNEINSDNSTLHLNYGNTNNISMCHGGGSVIIGPIPDNVDNNKLYVNGPTTLNSVATFNGLVTNNGGILPASYDVNKNNTACYVWGDAMSTGVTAITDALDPKYVAVNYSRDNGRDWTNYVLSDEQKFSLYANNGNYIDIYSGNKQNEGDTAPVRVNQLMVTFEIPSNLYSQLCWASVDIGNGVQTICTVEIIAKDGTIKNTFTKSMYGWNQFNYINFWGINNSTVSIGWDGARFVRFKFKHDANNIQLRNAQIRKIRLFSFTKYNLDNNDFRSVMAYTGHLYKYNQNLDVRFPNAIYCNTLYVGGTLNITNSTINCLEDNISIKSKKSGSLMIDGKEIIQYDLSNINFNTKTYFPHGICIGAVGPELGNNITTDNISVLIGVVPQSWFTFTFKRAQNGQLLFLKLQKINGTNNKVYCTTQDCSVVRADNFETNIAENTRKEIFGDGKSRIFIYISSYAQWIEFYCG